MNFSEECVLETGESVENDKLGIQVLKIKRPEKCYPYMAEWHNVEVEIMIYRVPDKKVLIQRSFSLRNTLLCEDPISGPEYGIVGISVADLNSKDGWVHFALIG